MQIIETQVREGNGVKAGFTVDFIGDGNERISVEMAQSGNNALTRENAVQKARVILLQAGSFNPTEKGGEGKQDSDAPSEASEAVKSLNQERKDDNRSGSALQEGLEDSFPASDPVSATYTSTAATEQKPEHNH
ncbi:hypothetical protein [Rhizobium sp. SL42]|uniref:hypothetical protein n=1 Tax=Rhizobium sp. SL42 TaxID=2806346 RepID=UPI001F308F88|nr:hypothetical protein [Rhizobium sp. SL42]UJW74986.1 hypothetical protein IM739_00190 [Rhizobium sp. SL42]